MNKKTKNITTGAMIAALYVILTMISHMAGMDSGVIQLRLSEALCIMPCFTYSAVWGLFVGCLLSNIFAGCVIWDIIFGSLATLIGAVGTYKLRNKRGLAVVPPILANALIVPFVLEYAYGVHGTIYYFMLTVGIGEVLSCGVLGQILYSVLYKKRKFFE